MVHVDKLKLCTEPEAVNSPVIANASCSGGLRESTEESRNDVARPFACSSCSKCFRREFDLMRHERDKHPQVASELSPCEEDI